LGDTVRSNDRQLAAELDKDNSQIGKVIEYTARALKNLIKRSGDVDELQAHAGYLRRLRNYGLHPGSEPDAVDESAFSEAKAATLLAQTGSYLRLMAELRAQATVKLAAGDDT
jgi:hypothetical protein